MNKLVLVFSIALLTSCGFGINIIGYTSPQMSVDEAWKMASSYRYIPESPNNYWKSPKEFESDGGGDCEDFTSYMMYLIGKGSSVMLLWKSKSGGIGFHSAVKIDDKIYEPQTYGHYIILGENDDIAHGVFSFIGTMGYGEVMEICTNGGMKAALTK